MFVFTDGLHLCYKILVFNYGHDIGFPLKSKFIEIKTQTNLKNKKVKRTVWWSIGMTTIVTTNGKPWLNI